MPFIPVDFALIEVELTIPGDAGPAFLTFGVGPVTAFNAQEVAVIVADALNNADSIRNTMHTSTIQTKVTARRRISASAVAIGELDVNVPGVQGGDAISPQVALLVSKTSGLAGRQNRGRMYIPGQSETNVDGAGVVLPTFRTTAQNAVDVLLGDLDTLETPMVILHVDPADTPTPVTALTVRNKVATQRRRLR